MTTPTPMTAYLVGAGPGDPGLLTARAIEVIARADVILHDRLIPSEALTHARPDAEIIDVGKVGGGEQTPQEETTRLLVEHARAGRSVVRLKGGDPFVFGRGGEEAQALRAAGCAFEVVPGVTAGVPSGGRQRGRLRHRPRGPGQGRDRDRLGRARGVPRNARVLHGRPPAAADRRAAHGPWP
jgi:uroporphyrinogen III methyltransferase/synthase